MAVLAGELAEAGRLEQAGRLDEAEAAYRRVLKRRPRDISALNLLGLLCHRRGRHADAAALIGRALALQPMDAEALGNLGAIHVAMHDLTSAIACFRRATVTAPRSAAAWANLAKALQDSGNAAGAVESYQRAIAVAPDWPELQRFLARAQFAAGDVGAAAHAYATAVAGDPSNADNWADLGAARHRLGDLSAAKTALQEAIRISPHHTAAWRNLGAVENDNSDDEAAIACFDRAIASEPHRPEAHVFRGISLLRSGRFSEGWVEYEWRLVQRRQSRGDPGFDRARWRGEYFAGRRLLIHAEQGFGDTIQFMRYLPFVRARGGEILFEVQEPLRRLIASSPLAAGILIIGRRAERPAFDLHCPLLSLPAIFGTDLTNIPAELPYLFAEPAFMPSLPPRRQARRCAIVWEGNLANAAGRGRSMPGPVLDRLASLQNIEFVSLQIDPVTRPERLALIDAGPLLRDFASTAAVLADAAMLITVDTAAAHLAGAMGKPAWVLLSHAADWRWLKGRSDSPWYPSLRLLRQSGPGDWDSLIAQVTDEITRAG